MKVDLEVDRTVQKRWAFNPSVSHLSLLRCWPYFRSKLGRSKTVHLVRSGVAHYFDGEYQHTSLDMWCGQGGFMHKGILTAARPRGQICRRCLYKSARQQKGV